MKWEKLGRILDPTGRAEWMVTHAALPFAQHIQGDVFRIYCSGRDAEGRAQEGYFEVDLRRPHEILTIADKPVIHVGPLGTFDDRGSLSSWIVNVGALQYHYFTGVMLGQTVPFYYGIGLATSRDGGRTAEKVSQAPILGLHSVDPYLTASPCVLIENGVWRMWYMSGTAWKMEDGTPKHYYLLKYAESSDGISWRREGRVVIGYAPGEYAISRPSVLKDGDTYRMWFASRGHKYRIAYAESVDGLDWIRKDEEAGITVSEDGWDSDMLCYPHVFDHAGERYMLYNGNDYGKTGIGLARLVG
jgi:hypothetical protein